MKLALIVCLVVLAALALYFGFDRLVLPAKIAVAGFVLGFLAAKIYDFCKTLRYDGLIQDLRYAKMRHELRRSIKP